MTMICCIGINIEYGNFLMSYSPLVSQQVPKNFSFGAALRFLEEQFCCFGVALLACMVLASRLA